ncbi:MAG: ClC family H(+)/Cl(-) exchange transporter [Acetilactobacillus jinshanensis]
MSANHDLLSVIILINVALAIIIGKIISKYKPVSGSGIPQIEAELTDRRWYYWWPVLWRKFITSTLTVGSGVFMGHEGPSIQLGGSAAQGLAVMTHQDHSRSKLMVAGGAAAGLTAVFNTPIASSLFILETVYHDFSAAVWLITLSAAVISDLVSMSIFGKAPLLYVPQVKAIPLNLFPQLLVMGIIIGLLGFGYKVVTLNSFMIPIGILSPQLIGTGSGLIHLIVKTPFPILVIAGYFVIRLTGSSLAFGSGLPGGIFLPILTFGALTGAGYARFLIEFNGMPSVYLASFVVVAMAGYFACVTKSPLTSILLITEMVGTLHHLAALSLVVIVAYLVDDLLNGQPIYHTLLDRLLS